MQPTPVDAAIFPISSGPTPVDFARFPDRAVVRLPGALRLRLEALAARAEVYVDEVEFLSPDTLRALGLVTYQSPLLGRLLEKLPEIIERELLSQLSPADRAAFALVDNACRDAVRASKNFAYAARAVGVELKVRPGRYCSPRYLSHFKPWVLESHGNL